MSIRYRLIESPKGKRQNFPGRSVFGRKWLFACRQAGADSRRERVGER